MRSLHDGFTNKVGKLVSILNRSGQTQSSRPIIVEMREGVSQTLMDVGREIASIFDNVVSSWGDSSLGDFLGNQEKVKALVESHN